METLRKLLELIQDHPPTFVITLCFILLVLFGFAVHSEQKMKHEFKLELLKAGQVELIVR